MLKKLFLLGAGLLTLNAHAQEIATCRAPEGYTFFHYAGIAQKGKAGWDTDKISKGVFTLRMVGMDAVDILYVDIANKPISSAQDGARVILLRQSQDSIAVLVAYPSVTEIYTFFVEKDGRHRFSLMQSKSGPEIPFPKSTLLVGNCDAIQFPK
jgi:hypothetical protein